MHNSDCPHVPFFRGCVSRHATMSRPIQVSSESASGPTAVVTSPTIHASFSAQASQITTGAFELPEKRLHSRNPADVLAALRYITLSVSRSGRGAERTAILPQVVKNVASPDPAIRRLVRLYLLHHGSGEEVFLLAVNSLQKDLKGFNPYERALSLRVLAQGPEGGWKGDALRAGCRDVSPWVRRVTAVLSIKSECNTDELITDASPYVLSRSVLLIPQSATIHDLFHHVVGALPDMDDFGKAYTLSNILLPYTTKYFPSPSKWKDGFALMAGKNTDIELSKLLGHVEDMFFSLSSAVLVAATLFVLKVAPTKNLVHKAVSALFRLSDVPFVPYEHEDSFWGRTYRRVDVSYEVYDALRAISVVHPSAFKNYMSSLSLRSIDSPSIMKLKLGIMRNVGGYLKEYEKYLFGSMWMVVQKAGLIRDVVESVGRALQNKVSGPDLLMKLLKHENETVVGETITVLRRYLSETPMVELLESVIKAVRTFYEPSSSSLPRTYFWDEPAASPTKIQAKASLIWLVGSYLGYPSIQRLLPDILRMLLSSFVRESKEVKYQVLALAWKSAFVLPDPPRRLVDQVFQLARYDADVHVRDRQRFLSVIPWTEPKALAAENQVPADAREPPLLMGSLSRVSGKKVQGYVGLGERRIHAVTDEERLLRSKTRVGQAEGAPDDENIIPGASTPPRENADLSISVSPLTQPRPPWKELDMQELERFLEQSADEIIPSGDDGSGDSEPSESEDYGIGENDGMGSAGSWSPTISHSKSKSASEGRIFDDEEAEGEDQEGLEAGEDRAGIEKVSLIPGVRDRGVLGGVADERPEYSGLDSPREDEKVTSPPSSSMGHDLWRD